MRVLMVLPMLTALALAGCGAGEKAGEQNEGAQANNSETSNPDGAQIGSPDSAALTEVKLKLPNMT